MKTSHMGCGTLLIGRSPKQLRVLWGSSLSCESQWSPHWSSPAMAAYKWGTAAHWLFTTEGEAEVSSTPLLSRLVASQLHQA